MPDISKYLETLHSNSKLKELREKLIPAPERIIAAEMTRLVMIFRISPILWADIAKTYLETLHHIPADLLHDAVSSTIANAKSGDYFPRPGDILAKCSDELSHRQTQLELALPWPKWLEEIWGPLPEGPIKRRNAHTDKPNQQNRFLIAAAYRWTFDCGEPMPTGLNDDHTKVIDLVARYKRQRNQ